jgi:hypothetical protein
MRLSSLVIGIAIAASAVPASAATIVYDLASGSGFGGEADDGYTADFTASGLALTRLLGGSTGFGAVRVAPKIAIKGAFSITVEAIGLMTGLTQNGESGLVVSNGTSFADAYGYNNDGTIRVLDFIGGLTAGGIATDDGHRLFISGNTNGARFTVSLFLLQQFGQTPYNSVTYRDLSVSADRIAAVPEPAGWAMLLAGFAITGAMLRRGKRTRVRFV